MLVPAAAKAQCCSRGRAGAANQRDVTYLPISTYIHWHQLTLSTAVEKKYFFPVTVLFFFFIWYFLLSV